MVVSSTEAQPKRNKNNFVHRGALWVWFRFYLSPAIAVSLARHLADWGFCSQSSKRLQAPHTKGDWEPCYLETDVNFNHSVCGDFFPPYSVRITCQALTTHCLCVNVHSSRPEEHDTREDKVKADPQSPSPQLSGLCKLKQQTTESYPHSNTLHFVQ